MTLVSVCQYVGDFVVAVISDREFGRGVAIRALRELVDELDGQGRDRRR